MKSIPYKRLVFAYLSMAGIIAFFVIAAQLVIQLALFQETSTRNLASTMALQELRTQATFKNSLLAILPEPYQTQLNSLKVKPIDALKKNLSDIEGTNQILIGPGTPTGTAVQIQNLQSAFYNMDTAGHQLLNDVNTKDTKDAGKQIATLFIYEQNYLQGTYNAYNDLTVSADNDVISIRILEAILCVSSLAVLTAEVKLVVWPALKDYEDYKEHQKDEENKAANEGIDSDNDDENAMNNIVIDKVEGKQ